MARTAASSVKPMTIRNSGITDAGTTNQASATSSMPRTRDGVLYGGVGKFDAFRLLQHELLDALVAHDGHAMPGRKRIFLGLFGLFLDDADDPPG